MRIVKTERFGLRPVIRIVKPSEEIFLLLDENKHSEISLFFETWNFRMVNVLCKIGF